MAEKKRSALVWIGGGCLGILVIAALVLVAGGYYASRRPKQREPIARVCRFLSISLHDPPHHPHSYSRTRTRTSIRILLYVLIGICLGKIRFELENIHRAAPIEPASRVELGEHDRACPGINKPQFGCGGEDKKHVVDDPAARGSLHKIVMHCPVGLRLGERERHDTGIQADDRPMEFPSDLDPSNLVAPHSKSAERLSGCQIEHPDHWFASLIFGCGRA